MDISFIIVNYRSSAFLERCLQSLEKKVLGLNWEAVIVNNDPRELDLFLTSSNIRIINNGSNGGFSNACNLGAKNSRGDILFFLNPDTELLTSNVSEIINFFSIHKNVGIVSPRLLTSNETNQAWSAGLNVTLWDIIKNNFGFIKSKYLWSVTQKTQADWVSGAALAIKKSIFENVNGYDENFFMYFEDVDLCKKVARTGKKIIILPSIKILHLGGQSILNTKKQKLIYYKSQDYYFKKHFGIFQVFLLKILRYFSMFLKK